MTAERDPLDLARLFAAEAAASRISSLETALTSLIARIRKVGGYSTPEEQDALRTAEWVLAGGVL